ncbi:MAG: hypothetical protein ACI9EF_003564, partial [Pseudohongiellaceae bacterium]
LTDDVPSREEWAIAQSRGANRKSRKRTSRTQIKDYRFC